MAALSPLGRKLAAWTSLSPGELAALDDLHTATRTVASNRDLITEGYKYDAVFVLLDGVAIRYRVLHDGRRQILNVVLPGDFVGFPACFFETALYSITAITAAAVAAIPFTRLFGSFENTPRLAATIFWLFSCEAAMYAERLINVGRRSALERVAHFLLELLTRLRVIGLAEEFSFRMPLTQEQIGDILGLTGVHVSRMLRRLRDDALIAVEGQQIAVRDLKALSALADFDRTYLTHFRMSDALFPARPGPRLDLD